MSYGGTAAIHAFILSCIRCSSTPLIPDAIVWLSSSESVWVRGLVLDLDMDATLAINGVGFLMLLPLAFASTTFQKSKAKPILVAWGILMLVGILCCLTNLYTVNATPSGPFHQIRFCPPNLNNSLPISNPNSQSVGDWNSTVWRFFDSHTPSVLMCFYPCYHSSQVLHSQSDITVIAFPEILPPSSRYWTFKIISAVVYGCMPQNIVACLLLVALRSYSRNDAHPRKLVSPHSILADLNSLSDAPITRASISAFLSVAVQIYAMFLAPVIALIFVVFSEWSLTLDPNSESFRHVGQWQPLVAVALVLIAAIIAKYSEALSKFANLCCLRRTKGEPMPPLQGQRNCTQA